LLGPGRADLHLGRGVTLRPDTLTQTGQTTVWKPLANGARHTFSKKNFTQKASPAIRCLVDPGQFSIASGVQNIIEIAK
jgi:hypothetical protein